MSSQPPSRADSPGGHLDISGILDTRMNPFSSPQDALGGTSAIKRWAKIWSGISIGLLLVCTLVGLFDGHLSVALRLLCLGFMVVFGLWFWFFIVGLARWGRSSPLLALSFVGMTLLLAGMSLVNGVYLTLLFSLYGLIFSALEIGLAIPITLFLSTCGVVSIIYKNHLTLQQSTGVILGFGLTTIIGIILGLFITAIIDQSFERQKAIDELQTTRAELAAAERQAGIFQERQRLAREIHDTLAQGFTSIVMHLEAADQALPAGPEQETARAHLDRARQTARDSLAEARRLVWALRPESLERESLNQALERVVQRWSLESAIPARVAVTGVTQALHPNDQVTLLRCAQEALANIHKHARADEVILTLSYLEDQVILDVADNGAGFNVQLLEAAGPSQGGFGLIGMRERVQQQGGSLTVESEPGAGTTLVIVLPIGIPVPIALSDQESP
jgi:signal transduction histidine kinase